MEAKIKKYLHKTFKGRREAIDMVMAQYQESLDCKKHRWVKLVDDYGYKCENCGYFTQTDDELNELIKKLLITKTK